MFQQGGMPPLSPDVPFHTPVPPIGTTCVSDLRDRRDPGCGPACEESAVGMESRESFAAPSLGEQSPQPCPSVPGRAGGARHEQRCHQCCQGCRCCCFPANSQLFSHFSPAPLTPSPCATATSRSLPLPTLPATHLGHTRHGQGFLWKKRHPTKPGLRCGSCQGLSLTHLTLLLLCPHQQDCQRHGDGGLWEGDVFPRWFYSEAFSQTCPGPACEVMVAQAGHSWDCAWAPLLEQDQAVGNSPPFPASLAEASSCG